MPPSAVERGSGAASRAAAEPVPTSASKAVEAEPPAPPATALPPASFADVVLLVPADNEREEVEVRVTFHPERFVVFDVDAGRIVWQVFYRKPASNATAAVLLGTPRFLTGSERWFILPTSAGEIVLRLDLDASGDIVGAFEARSGMRVLRRRGEFSG